MESLESVSETLDTEVKGWLNLDVPREAALFAKACLALRNNDGGRIIFGIDDGSYQRLTDDAPTDVVAAYHPDKITTILGKYSVPKFDVTVEMMSYKGHPHPVISIPVGIRSPVIAKSGFERELRQNAVYVRTISNGRPSSSEPMTAADWDKLMRACFDNREADIGRFMRRHLGEIVEQLRNQGSFGTVTPPPEVKPEQAALEFLEAGRRRFDLRWKEKSNLLPPQEIFPIHGLREMACVLKGSQVDLPLNSLLDTLFVHQPDLTGWPPWVDTRSFDNKEAHPYVKARGWEALIMDLKGGWHVHSVDFWRVEPTLRFYAVRTYEDDTSNALLGRGVKPKTVLDFVLLITRTAELIGTARAFVRGAKLNCDECSLECAFRWSGLKGRHIGCWVSPERELRSHTLAEDDEIVTTASIPMETPDSLIWKVVQRVTQPVFDVFASGVSDRVMEELVKERLKRR